MSNMRPIFKYAITALAASAVTLAIVAAAALLNPFRPTGPQLTGIAKLAPPHATGITVWNLEELRSGDHLDAHPTQPSVESFMEDRMLFLNRTPAVDPYELRHYLVIRTKDRQPVEIATGPMDFHYMEIELQDAGYTKRNHRGYDIWEGSVAYAFLP